MTAWFETAGERGVLEIERRDGSWYVLAPASDEAIRRLGLDANAPEEGATRRLRASVSSYKRSAGSAPHMVFLTDVAAAPDATVGAEVRDEGTRGPGVDDEQPPSGEESSLDRIARERLGGHEFTIEAEAESLVGGARQRASDQQRDAAIDPRLRDGDPATVGTDDSRDASDRGGSGTEDSDPEEG